MTPAAEHSAARGGGGLTAAWLVLLAVTVLAGLAMPPAGAAVAAIGAVRAHADGRAGLRAAFVALAVLFVVITVFTGFFLMSWGGGGTTATQTG